MIKESDIDNQFNQLYKSVVQDLKKQNKEHYLKAKKLNSGIQLGKIKLQSNNNGFILRDTSLKRKNIIYKEIAYRKSAIMLAVLLNKNRIDCINEILSIDAKYGIISREVLLLEAQIKRFRSIKNWTIVDVCYAKLTGNKQNLYAIKKDLDMLYLRYVF